MLQSVINKYSRLFSEITEMFNKLLFHELNIFNNDMFVNRNYPISFNYRQQGRDEIDRTLIITSCNS